MAMSISGARSVMGTSDVGMACKRRREGVAGGAGDKLVRVENTPYPSTTKKTDAYVQKHLLDLPLIPAKIPASYEEHLTETGIIPGLVKAELNDEFGDGIFATEDLAKGRFVGVFAGVTMVEKTRGGDYKSPDTLVIHSDLASETQLKINGAIKGNFTRYIKNGERAANVKATIYRDLANRVFVILETTKDIPSGQQLLLSYGPDRFSRGVTLKPDTFTYDAEADLVVPPAIGSLDGIDYFFPHPSCPAYFEKRSLLALSKFRLPHVECPRKFTRAFHKIFMEAIDLDAEKARGSSLRFIRDAVADYEEVLGSEIPIPSFLQMAAIPIGYGIFARENIAGNTFIGCFSGEIVESKDLEDPAYSFNVDDRFSIDAKRVGNYIRFVNHSKENANVIFKYARLSDPEGNPVLAVLFFTAKDVSAGEQLLYDYEDSYDWISMIGKPPEEMTPMTYQLDLETGKTKAHGIIRRKSMPPKILDL